jgi:hypothetical protein
MFELGEDLFDGVEIGTVWRQEEELGANAADSLANSFSLVAAEVRATCCTSAQNHTPLH